MKPASVPFFLSASISPGFNAAFRDKVLCSGCFLGNARLLFDVDLKGLRFRLLRADHPGACSGQAICRIMRLTSAVQTQGIGNARTIFCQDLPLSKAHRSKPTPLASAPMILAS